MKEPEKQLSYKHNYVRKTTCEFTVVFQCVDPPVPCGYLNTNNEAHARRVFEALKQQEIDNLGGGEFTLTLYRHTKPFDEREIKYWAIKEKESDYDFPYVYAIMYKNSETLAEFSYMDLVRG